MIRLIGIVIIVVGFVLKLDTLAVVLAAGIVTGLVAGMPIMEILKVIGTAFVNTRYMSLFLLTLPVVGLVERYGLKERATYLIGRIKNISTGKVLGLYTLVREIAGALSLRLGGHVQFIRPLILPMAQGASEAKYGDLEEEDSEKIKGLAAASENYGNFFAQNVFVASGGVLLIVGTLNELGVEVTALEVSKAAIPVAIISFIVSGIQYYLFDRKLERKYGKRTGVVRDD